VQDRLKSLVDEMYSKGIRYEDARREMERHFIDCALEACDGSLTRAAETLGLPRNTLARKIEEHRKAARRYGR
jgi:DNA-binding NtrC family response regulator